MNRPPSEVFEVRRWVREKYGLDGWWTAYQFDSAILYVGTKIENALSEFETKIVNGHETTVPRYKDVSEYLLMLEAGKAQGASGAAGLISAAKKTGAYKKV